MAKRIAWLVVLLTCAGMARADSGSGSGSAWGVELGAATGSDLLALNEGSGRRRQREWNNGPRAVPRARGRAFARAQALGIGGHFSTKHLLWTRPSSELLAAVPGDRPRSLLWPVVNGKWGRGFGFTRKVLKDLRHNGIDIGAPAGTAVRAAADGLVIYSDNTLHHLGNAVMILHPGGWTTLYAHNSRTTVQAGWYVKRGERIALVGQTGAAWGPHVHFELRDNGRWIDPAPYLVGYRETELVGPLVELKKPMAETETVAVAEAEAETETAAETETETVAETKTETEAKTETVAETATESEPGSGSDSSIQLPVFDYGSLKAARRVLRGELPQTDEAALGRKFSNLLFPVKGGTRGRGFEGRHRGIDVTAEAGAPVRAAADGVVLYSGPGVYDDGLHAIVILHRNGWITVYGAVRADGAVEAGTRVLRGEWIGRVSERQGAASELHFEWHEGAAASDPSALLIGQ